jgi:ABC-type transporter lipoprotein component MlaA
VQRYVVGPLGELTAPTPRGGAGGDPRYGGEAMPAALTQPPATATPDGPGDPLEPINRRIFALNSSLRAQLLEPVVGFYRGQTPPAVQQSVQNFFSNLREPITMVSGVLEGDLGDAGNAAARFGINTTVGIAGLYDPATGYGYPRRTHNLEEALCVYRLPSGPYIVLPLYGPATLRDAVGRLATVVAYFEAMGFGIYVPYRLGDAVAQSANTDPASRLGEVLSPDPYLAQKEAFFDGREAGCARYVRNGTDKLSP